MAYIKLPEHIRTSINNLDTEAGEIIDYLNDNIDPYISVDHPTGKTMKLVELIEDLNELQDKITSIQEDQKWI